MAATIRHAEPPETLSNGRQRPLHHLQLLPPQSLPQQRRRTDRLRRNPGWTTSATPVLRLRVCPDARARSPAPLRTPTIPLGDNAQRPQSGNLQAPQRRSPPILANSLLRLQRPHASTGTNGLPTTQELIDSGSRGNDQDQFGVSPVRTDEIENCDDIARR
jgi:hypothetical protein